MKANQYRCEHCGKIDTRTTPEADMEEEHKRNFGHTDISTAVIICDDCYKEFIKWFHAETGSLN